VLDGSGLSYLSWNTGLASTYNRLPERRYNHKMEGSANGL
jgi:hypothetical protein